MIQYPIHFHVGARSESGIASLWETTSADRKTLVAIPPEFEGPGGAQSPEDLFAQSLAGCFVATFKVLAEKSRFPFGALSARGVLTVDRDDAKRPVMRAFHLKVEIAGAADAAKATRLVQKTLESGFILNSVKTLITHELVLVDNLS